MTFGKHLRYLRAAREVSQRRLAELLDIHPAYLSRVERDHQQYVPNFDTLARIIKALDLQQKEADGLFVAAGKLPPDVHAKLLQQPQLFSRIRKA
jgi:transcriptional regulator with XRE-family HTH domain